MQQPQQLRPMGIGRILDRSFQLYRTHFTTLAIIMLALYGPMAIVSMALATDSSNTTSGLMDTIRNGGIDGYLQSIESGEGAGLSGGAVLAMLLGFVLMLLLGPVSVAAIVHLVQAHLRGEEIPSAGELLKKGFRRLWPLTGSTLLYGIIMLGLYLLVVVAFAFAVGILFAAALSGTDAGAGPAMLLLVPAVIGVLLLITFFAVRWAFYLPFVALNESGTGVGASWRLTKGSFWRLLLLYLVLWILLAIFTGVLSLGSAAIFGGGVLNSLVDSLVSILIGSLWVLPYAIAFFDLRVRREGWGLETLLDGAQPYGGQTPPPPPAGWGGGYGAPDRTDRSDEGGSSGDGPRP
ncbi:glycerophosphoryl diester phosphodiesterase membrane domain-containing protein [Paenibacillus sp. FSL W8-1187]|nr:glycerophosphoryl diester phosphodiesterase membrane domain-containing protein [Paenibacillus pasadenensis]